MNSEHIQQPLWRSVAHSNSYSIQARPIQRRKSCLSAPLTFPHAECIQPTNLFIRLREPDTRANQCVWGLSEGKSARDSAAHQNKDFSGVLLEAEAKECGGQQLREVHLLPCFGYQLGHKFSPSFDSNFTVHHFRSFALLSPILPRTFPCAQNLPATAAAAVHDLRLTNLRVAQHNALFSQRQKRWLRRRDP